MAVGLDCPLALGNTTLYVLPFFVGSTIRGDDGSFDIAIEWSLKLEDLFFEILASYNCNCSVKFYGSSPCYNYSSSVIVILS